MTPKKYRLIRELPGVKVGTELEDCGCSNYQCLSDGKGCWDFPENVRKDWLEEIDGKWRPSSLMRYFFPFPTDFSDPCDEAIWDGDHVDISRFEVNLVCRTKEEAIAKAEKMLEAIKE